MPEIGHQQKAPAAARGQNAYLAAILRTMRQPLVVLDGRLTVETANRAFYATFSVAPAETVGRRIYDLGDGQWNIPDLRALFEELLPQDSRIEDYRVEHLFERIGNRVMLLNAQRIALENGDDRILIAVEDITERERAYRQVEAQRDYARKIVDAARDPLLVLDLDLRVKSTNDTFYRAFRVDPAETEGRLVYELGNGQWDIPRLRELLEKVLPDNDTFDDFVVEHDFVGLGPRTMVLNARRVEDVELILLAFEDRTEARRAAAERRASENRFRAFVTASADVMYRMSPDWFEMRQLDGRGFLADTVEADVTWLDRYVQPGDQAEVMAAVRRAIDGREMFELEHRVMRADGTPGWTHSRAVPIFDAEGALVEWFGAAADVTTRRATEEALKDSEDRHRALFEAIDEGVCLFERLPPRPDGWRDYRYTAMNRTMQRMFGIPDLSGRSMREAFPDEGEAWYDDYDRVLDTGEPMWIVRRSDPQGMVLEMFVTRVEDSTGPCLMAVMKDVTERVRAEEAVRESERKYRGLFETMQEGHVECEMIRDAQGRAVDYRVLSANPQYERLTGIPAERAVGRSARELLPELDAWWIETFDRVVTTGEATRFEQEAPTLGRWFEMRAFPFGGDRFAVLFDDITERRRAEDARREREQRQRFLLELSDRLRVEADADALGAVACRMLAGQLGVDRCWIARLSRERMQAWLGPEYRAEGLAAISGEWSTADFPGMLRRAETETLVIRDVANDAGLGRREKAALKWIGFGACLAAILRKGERNYVWALAVSSRNARAWTDAEIELVEEASERVWAALERTRAEAALRESERRMRNVLDGMGEAFGLMDHDLRIITQNKAALDLDGRPLGMICGRTHWEAYPGSEGSELGRVYRRALAEQQPVSLEHHYSFPDGATFWLEMRAFPVPDGLAVFWRDITERKEAEAARRESEERFRQFGDASPDALWIRDADTLDLDYFSPAFERIHGVSRKEALSGRGMDFLLSMVDPEDRDRIGGALEGLHDGPRSFEYRIRRPSDGETRWLRTAGFPLVDPSGRMRWVGGITHDMTEEKRAADRMEVLVSELQHRTRNLITVVRAMATRTIMGVTSLAEFQERYGARLMALSRVNGLLSRLGEGARVNFDEIIRAELAGQGVIDEQGVSPQVSIDGQQGVRLRSASVQTLALAVHELLTNAVRHGALSRADGHLPISWHVTDEPGPCLVIDWRETWTATANDPPRSAPTGHRRGYGRELIERALPYQLGAETHYDLQPDGLHCRITLPIGDHEQRRPA